MKSSKHGVHISTFAYLVFASVGQPAAIFFLLGGEENSKDVAIWVKG